LMLTIRFIMILRDLFSNSSSHDLQEQEELVGPSGCLTRLDMW